MERWILTLTLCAALIAGVCIEAADASQYSIEQLLDRALATHPSLHQAREEVRRAEATLDRVNSGLSWRVDGVIDATGQRTLRAVQVPYELRGVDVPEHHQTYVATAALSRSLFRSHESEEAWQKAGIAVEGSVSALREARDKVVAEVLEAYLDVFIAARAGAVAEDALALAIMDLAVVEDRYGSGTAVESNVIASQAEVESSRVDLMRAETGLTLSLRLLSLLTGIPSLQVEDLVPPDEEIGVPTGISRLLSASLDEMLDLAVSSRPDLARADLAVRAAVAGLVRARAGRRPSLTLSGFYEFSDDDVRLATSIGSDGRFQLSVSAWHNTLPDVGPSAISDEDWEDIEAILDELFGQDRPDFIPDRDQLDQLLGGPEIAREDRYEVRLTLSSPIFDSGLVSAEIRAAEAETAAARAVRDGALHLVELEVTARYRGLIEAEQAYRAALTRWRSSKAMREEALPSRDYGALTRLDELRLDLAVAGSRLELERALRDLTVAEVNLALAVGLDPVESLKHR